MDQVARNYIEQAIDVKVGDELQRGVYSFTGGLSELGLDELAKNDYAAVEWQDPDAHDCGNNDGILYVYLPAIEDCGELFIGLDNANSLMYIS
ncbi:hypothetical protein D3C80_1160180 [compost metagenome]